MKPSVLQFIIASILATYNLSAFAQITEMGVASFYDDKFEGRITASGEVFSQKKLTAAHRTLPFGTVVKVTNLENQQSVEVTVNDRGPFVSDRLIDLSKTAATKLNFTATGTVRVKVEVVSIPDNQQENKTITTDNTSKNETKKAAENTKTAEPEKKADLQVQIYEGINPEYFQINSKPVNPKGFGIQLASFQEAANLIKRCAEITGQLKQEVIIQVAGNSDSKVYRIILGPFETREEAEKYIPKLADFKGCFVIRLDK